MRPARQLNFPARAASMHIERQHFSRPRDDVDHAQCDIQQRPARHAFVQVDFPDLAAGAQTQGIKFGGRAKRDIDQIISYRRRATCRPVLCQRILGMKGPVLLARQGIQAEQRVRAAAHQQVDLRRH